VLRLANPNSDPVAFKVKTTAPKQYVLCALIPEERRSLTMMCRYCVRPNSGRIEPGQSVEVQVLLQAMKEDPPPDARCRDKFLVQSVAISADKDVSNVAQIWANIEQTAKSSIQEKKIRVVFLPADGTATPAAAGGLAAGANGVSHHESSDPPAYSPATTPQRNSSSANYEKSPMADSTDTFHQSESTTSRSALAGAVANVTGMDQSDLQRKLDEAQATIAQLKNQAAEQTGLRQRKAGADTTSSNTMGAAATLQTNPSGGVPVQIVALLCLICFLIAYMFF
jgi:hypothetical protein